MRHKKKRKKLCRLTHLPLFLCLWSKNKCNIIPALIKLPYQMFDVNWQMCRYSPQICSRYFNCINLQVWWLQHGWVCQSQKWFKNVNQSSLWPPLSYMYWLWNLLSVLVHKSKDEISLSVQWCWHLLFSIVTTVK